MFSVLRGFVRLLFQVLFYGAARLLLPVFTFGWWRVQPLTGPKKFLFGKLWERQPDGTVLFSFDAAVILGMLLLSLVFVLVVLAVKISLDLALKISG